MEICETIKALANKVPIGLKCYVIMDFSKSNDFKMIGYIFTKKIINLRKHGRVHFLELDENLARTCLEIVFSYSFTDLMENGYVSH